MFTTRTRRQSRNTQPIRRPSIRLHVDQLELRAVPAVIAWDGGPTGMGTNWLDRVNWVGDVLPGANDDAVVAAGNASQLTQIPISGQVNANLRDNYGSDLPVAPTDVVVGSVPFHLVPQDSVPDSLGIIEAPLGQSVYTIPTNVAHPTVVYTLMNSVI